MNQRGRTIAMGFEECQTTGLLAAPSPPHAGKLLGSTPGHPTKQLLSKKRMSHSPQSKKSLLLSDLTTNFFIDRFRTRAYSSHEFFSSSNRQRKTPKHCQSTFEEVMRV